MQNRKGALVNAKAIVESLANSGGVVKTKGGHELEDTTMYIRFNAQGQAGIQQLVDTNTKREFGVTNFDGNKMNRGKNIIIDALRFRFGGTGAALLKNERFSGAVSFPAEFYGANLAVKQGSKTILSIPVMDCLDENSNAPLWRELSAGRLLVAEKEFDFEIEYPKGVTMPAGDEQNIELAFRVHQVKK